MRNDVIRTLNFQGRSLTPMTENVIYVISSFFIHSRVDLDLIKVTDREFKVR